VTGVLARCAFAALATMVVVAGAGSAAGPASNGRILFVDAANPGFTGLDLFTVNPDGSDRRRLTSDGRNSSAILSPNGERIAFLKSDGSSPRDLYVMNADGSGGARLIASHPETTNAGGIRGITWSPDSARIAYFLTSSSPIRVIDARDGTPVLLPQEEANDPRGPRPFGALEWSPDGSELVYDDGGDIWIKPLDGRPARQIVGVEGQDTRPTWSPDGSRIAFIHSGTQAAGGVYVVRRDGTDLRHVAATGTASVGTVRWKPDATAVVFDAAVIEGVGPRNTQLRTSRILVAGAEGSVLGVLRDHVAVPIPSPDNGQLLVGAFRVVPPGYETPKPGVYAMNADGSCLTFVTSGTAVGWQRVPAVPINAPRDCVDLVLEATAPGVVGLRGALYILRVRNEGTRAARNVRLRISLDRDVRFAIGPATGMLCSQTGSAVTCRLEGLEPGFAETVHIHARPADAVPLVAEIDVSSDALDSDPASNDASLRTRVYPCWIAGTDFNDVLIGTQGGEQICARAGDDFVQSLGGADRVDGGWGRDRLVGGAGRDRLVGGRGNDTILARDGERDTIECGWGDDRAFVDRVDRVLRGCEHVSRR
jgi:hypothetical protein